MCTGGSWAQLFQALLLGRRMSGNSKRLGALTMDPYYDFTALIELIEAGKVKPVIDRSYPLSEIGEAFHYYGKRHARGKVVITI